MGKADGKSLGMTAAVYASIAAVSIIVGKKTEPLFWAGLLAGVSAVYIAGILALVNWPREGIRTAVRTRLTRSRRRGKARTWFTN